jgi:FkbM family methyltransferase
MSQRLRAGPVKRKITPPGPANPGNVGSAEISLTSQTVWKRNSNLSQQIAALDAKLERMWLDLDFIRTRLSSYVGDGVALTYLADATPIYINSDDCGGPVNLLNGGRYEEENLEVLLSFITDTSIFLDIGANVGFFTLQVGKRVSGNGSIYAFEPHPKLLNLLRWNVHLNGLSRTVTCFPFGLSDQNSASKFSYPVGHLGGGAVGDLSNSGDYDVINSEIRRLDDVLGPDFACDLVKIDVEGHEFNVLKGMRRIIANSPKIKILFEKLTPNCGTETALEEFFDENRFDLYAVQSDSSLAKLGVGSLSEHGGYVLAARQGALDGGIGRSRFSIYPRQFLVPRSCNETAGRLTVGGVRGDILLHGPYWFLRKGVWRFTLHGAVKGAISFILQERFGHHVLAFLLEEGQSEYVFILTRDLIYFECVARPATELAELELDRLEFTREG